MLLVTGQSPISYEGHTLLTLDITTTQLGMKQFIRLNKTLATNASQFDEAFLGLKTHEEKEWTGDHFLAIRCETAPCATIPLV